MLDGTLGRPTPVLTGPNYVIDAGVGRQIGGNLFHSFGQFNVGTGQSATFSGPASVANIIGRVTGGNASSIDGLLRSTISGANLYLINPNGLVFGPNARLDVSGSFHATTADYLKLGAGGRYDARSPSASVLTSAPPSAFGFLGPPTGALSANGAELRLAPGNTLSLVGGAITLTDAYLEAPAGRVNLASFASSGEIQLTPSGITAPAGARWADIRATRSDIFADSSGPRPAGKIVIRGGGLELNDSFLSALNQSSRPAGGIDIALSGGLSMRESALYADSEGAGASGTIVVKAERISLRNDSGVTASSFGTGDSGSIALAADSVSLAGGSRLMSIADGGGNGGDIAISARALAMSNATANLETNGAGASGSFTIQAEHVSLANGAQVIASSFGAGRAGAITVTASGSLNASGRNRAGFRSGLFSTTESNAGAGGITIRAATLTLDDGIISAETEGGTGPGGNISVSAERFVLANGGLVTSSSYGNGRAGSIRVSASESMVLAGRNPQGFNSALESTADAAGNAGNISAFTPLLLMRDGVISSLTNGVGDAGDVVVRAGRIALLGGAQIITSSFGAGRGGQIDIAASRSLKLAGTGPGGFSSGLFSTARSSGAAGGISISAPSIRIDNGVLTSDTDLDGAAGDIRIQAGRVEVMNGGQVISNSYGAGQAGKITIAASESLAVTGRNADGLNSALTSTADAGGNAGDILVEAPVVKLHDALILSDSLGDGAAGNVTVRAGRLSVTGGGQISTTTFGSGPGGSIAIRATGSVSLSGASADGFASTLFSTTESTGNAGSVSMTAPVLALDGATITSETSGAGAAGNVTVLADRVSLNGGAQIIASAFGAGKGGRIAITAAGSLALAGRSAAGFSSGLFSTARSSGNAGGIAVHANRLAMSGGIITSETSGSGAGGSLLIRGGRITLADGSEITAGSSGSGRAGAVTIDAGASLQLTGGSRIATEATSSDGGNIHITARDLVYLRDSRITTAVGTGNGNGGNITIDPVFVVLDNSRVIANAFGGNGGNILIVSDFFLLGGLPLAEAVDASSERGISGEVSITAPNVDVSAGLSALPSGFFDASLLLRESCAARAARAGSSFTGVGRGGMPAGPGQMGFGRYAAGLDAAAGRNAGATVASTRFGGC